jgi:hypothetical protein
MPTRIPPPEMKVRLSRELRLKIEEAAEKNRRTLNAEVVARLEETFSSTIEKRVELIEQAMLGLIFDSRFQKTEDRLLDLETKLKDLLD